jgi:hypothetical protein
MIYDFRFMNLTMREIINPESPIINGIKLFFSWEDGSHCGAAG